MRPFQPGAQKHLAGGEKGRVLVKAGEKAAVPAASHGQGSQAILCCRRAGLTTLPSSECARSLAFVCKTGYLGCFAT